MLVIALSGKRGSGKSSCAQYLKEQHGAVVLSLAAPLRAELVALGFNQDIVYSKPTPEPIRKLLVALASARRWIDENYFVDILLGKLSDHYKSGVEMVVVDDMRYGNEKEKLAGMNARFVRVEMPDWARVVEAISGVDDHESETNLDSCSDFDYTVRALNGETATLHSQLELYLRSIA